MLSLLLFVPALLSYSDASPAPLPNNASPTVPSSCTAITSIVPASSATPFCSSYLSLTDKTVYTTSSATQTVTVTASATSTSTSYVFLPGNPPSPKPRRDISLDAAPLAERNTCNRDNCLRNLVDARYITSAAAFCSTYTATTTSIAVPTYIDSCGQPAVPSRLSSACSCAFPATTTKDPAYTSSACSCLSLTTSTKTSTAVADYVTTITAPAKPATTTKTVYPCASPLPSPGPAYGKAGGSVPPTQNIDLALNTPEGSSPESCCNACFFEWPNCVQAYYYDYEGCVISYSPNAPGTGQGVSQFCPAGTIKGLTYGPPGPPPFRSTGSIAGPCGETYSNF